MISRAKKYVAVLLAFVCVCMIFSPQTAYAAEDSSQHETVKVGFFAMDGYHVMDEEGNRSGYGYDFLRLMARYWDVDYEYVGYDKSWDDMQQMLEDGEIDMVTSARKTPDREEKFDFSRPIGTNYGMLTVRSDNSTIVDGDYSTYNGMRVALLNGNTRNEEFADFAGNKGFTYDPFYFDTTTEMEEALQSEKVDAIVTSSLRKTNNERIVDKFGSSDFYVIVKKGNTELLNEINYAIDQMNAVEGDWKTTLYNKNYESIETKNLEYTEKEKSIISQYSKDNPLHVLCDPTRYPYSYNENGEMKGIIPDYFRKIADYAGISYEFLTPATRDEYNRQNFKSFPLTNTMEACFAVRGGEGSLLSILNKTLKAMPSDMLTSALAIYDSTPDKVTFLDFLKDNILAFFVTAGFFVLSIISIILVLLRKARKAEAAAKLAANDTQKLNDKLEITLKKAEDASLAKTRFLNNMSHDIRTPMNAILGYAQLMEDEMKGKDLPETSEYLKKLQQSGNLLLSIINNVLDMARIESGRMEIDENYGMIEDIWQTLFEIFDDEAKKKNIALHYTINVEHEHILTDVTKVKEIFVNILSNTMKYTPSGGSVMINIDELPCSGPGYMIVRTRVSDTGIGMSQEYLTNIFEAFTRERNTTKSKIAGTGLGMSIVKKYVELLGGTIDVESELGKGSTFTVTLKHKIADENYYVKNYAENPETYSEILKDRKILLAEDNDLNAEIAEAILERAGLKTERVEDGIQCVNKIEKMPAGTYDMILMDIQMPKMNGYKATQAIRRLPDKDKAYIPIVAMTANAFEEDKRDAFAAGMNGHIAKPIQVDKLLSTLAEVWGKEMTDETDCHV